MVILCFSSAKWPSKVATLLCVPTRTEREFPLFYIFTSTWYCSLFEIKSNRQMYSGISLVVKLQFRRTYDVQNLFICLFGIYVYCLVRNLFRSFAHILFYYYCILRILCIYQIQVFYQIRFENVYLQAMASFHSFNSVKVLVINSNVCSRGHILGVPVNNVNFFQKLE